VKQAEAPKPAAPEPTAQQPAAPTPTAQQSVPPQPAPQPGVEKTTLQTPVPYSKIPVVPRDLFTVRGKKMTLDPARSPFLTVARAQRRVINISKSQPQILQVQHGIKARVGEWPWAAALLTDYYGDGGLYLYCGGSLIAPDWVLTAAHCDVDARDVLIVGENDLTKPAAVPVGIERVCTHESYNPTTLDFDVALVKLRQPLTQLRIPLQETSLQPGAAPTDATVVGWGFIDQGGTYSNDLQSGSLPLVSNIACTNAYPGSITPNMLCAGKTSDAGACYGDSGGPLMVSQSGSPGWYQLGIVSWGDDCSTPQNYGVYTKTESFRHWIENTIKGDNPLCPAKTN